MARKKDDIERDWKKAEQALEAAIAALKRPKDYETFEEGLAKLAKTWEVWSGLLAEADKKISEKDWKDDSKLDADRKKFKAYVISQRDKEQKKFEKAIFDIQKEFAKWVADSKKAAAALATIKAKILKALADFKTDKDAATALGILEDLGEEIGKVQSASTLKNAVFEQGRGLLKGIAAATPALEKAQKEQLRVDGDLAKMTYQDIRNNMKLFKAYCQMIKQPDHAKFFEATNYGAKGSEAIYRQFIVTNTVNVAATLVEEFNTIAQSSSPDWSKAPWMKVVKQIDGMLGSNNNQLDLFKRKLREARLA